MHDPNDHFRAVLSHFDLSSLDRLRKAMKNGTLVRGRYVDANGGGCLMWHLGQVRSRLDLERMFPDESYREVKHLVREFDNQTLTDEQLRQVLNEVMMQRRQINAAEERTIRRASARAARARAVPSGRRPRKPCRKG